MSKIRGSWQRGVYVSATTKKEFKENKSTYQEEGIKSAYSLQVQKDLNARIARSQAQAERKAIKEAFNKEPERFQEVNLTLKTLLEINKELRKYNKEIEKGVKQGKVIRDTPTLSFPINQRTGRINLDRLARQVRQMNKKISDIGEGQRYIFLNNVKEVFGEFVYDFTKEALKDVSIQSIYNEFDAISVLSELVRYDVRDFDDDAKERFWAPIASHQDFFVDTVKEIGGSTL